VVVKELNRVSRFRKEFQDLKTIKFDTMVDGCERNKKCFRIQKRVSRIEDKKV